MGKKKVLLLERIQSEGLVMGDYKVTTNSTTSEDLTQFVWPEEFGVFPYKSDELDESPSVSADVEEGEYLEPTLRLRMRLPRSEDQSCHPSP